jgi:Sigma-70, region 4
MTYAYAGKRDAHKSDRHWQRRQEEMLDSYGLSMQYDAVQTPEDILLERERAAILHNAMLELPARVERVMRQRWFRGTSLNEAGDDLGVTRERIRQIEYKGVTKLRSRLRTVFPKAQQVITRQQREVREAEERKDAFLKEQREIDLQRQAECDAAFEAEQAGHRAQWAEICRKTVEERVAGRAAIDEQQQKEYTAEMLAAHAERERKAKRKEAQARAHRAQVAQEIRQQEHNEAISLAYNTMLDEAVKRFERSRLAYVASLGGTHEEACYKEYVNAIYLHQLARRAWEKGPHHV